MDESDGTDSTHAKYKLHGQHKVSHKSHRKIHSQGKMSKSSCHNGSMINVGHRFSSWSDHLGRSLLVARKALGYQNLSLYSRYTWWMDLVLMAHSQPMQSKYSMDNTKSATKVTGISRPGKDAQKVLPRPIHDQCGTSFSSWSDRASDSGQRERERVIAARAVERLEASSAGREMDPWRRTDGRLLAS